MYIDVYDTYPMTFFKSKMQQTRKEIDQMIVSNLGIVPHNNRVSYVVDAKATVDRFSQPILTEHPIQNTPNVVIDLRSITRANPQTGGVVENQQTAFEFIRAKLMILAKEESPQSLSNVASLPILIHSELVSASMANRLNLDDMVRVKVKIMAAGWCFAQYQETDEMDEKQIERFAVKIGTLLRLPANELKEIFTQHPPKKDVTSFISNIQNYTQSIRLEQMTPGLLYKMFAGVWFGPNPNETVAVSLEHPATFMAMCYIASTDRSYKNKSVLGKLITTRAKRDQIETFVRSINRLM